MRDRLCFIRFQSVMYGDVALRMSELFFTRFESVMYGDVALHMSECP